MNSNVLLLVQEKKKHSRSKSKANCQECGTFNKTLKSENIAFKNSLVHVVTYNNACASHALLFFAVE